MLVFAGLKMTVISRISDITVLSGEQGTTRMNGKTFPQGATKIKKG